MPNIEDVTEELFHAQLIIEPTVGHGEKHKQIYFFYEGRKFLMFTNGPYDFIINESHTDQSFEVVTEITLPKDLIKDAVALYDLKSKFLCRSKYFATVEDVCWK